MVPLIVLSRVCDSEVERRMGTVKYLMCCCLRKGHLREIVRAELLAARKVCVPSLWLTLMQS
jgi:hypothetical protein